MEDKEEYCNCADPMRCACGNVVHPHDCAFCLKMFPPPALWFEQQADRFFSQRQELVAALDRIVLLRKSHVHVSDVANWAMEIAKETLAKVMAGEPVITKGDSDSVRKEDEDK